MKLSATPEKAGGEISLSQTIELCFSPPDHMLTQKRSKKETFLMVFSGLEKFSRQLSNTISGFFEETYIKPKWFINISRISSTKNLPSDSIFPEKAGRGILLISTKDKLIKFPVWVSLNVSPFLDKKMTQCQVLFESYEEINTFDLQQKLLTYLQLVNFDNFFDKCGLPQLPEYYNGFYLNIEPYEFGWFLDEINGRYYKSSIDCDGQKMFQVDFFFKLALKTPENIYEKLNKYIERKHNEKILDMIKNIRGKLVKFKSIH